MDDTISRAMAVDAVQKNTFRLTFAEEQNCEGRVAWSANAVYSDVIEGALKALPSAQPEDAEKDIRAMCGECDAWNIYKNYPQNYSNSHCFPVVEGLPSAQPEHLTDDDFETIRIHLDAYKEKLCNQGRWKEAKEYQRIYDRFMAFASAQSEIIKCKDCKHWFDIDEGRQLHKMCADICGDWFCADAERRTDDER